MILLHSGSGAQDVELDGEAMQDSDWRRLRAMSARLLRKRGKPTSADILESIPFQLRRGSNGFGDDFLVLYYPAPMEKYVEASDWADDQKQRTIFREIAGTVGEVVSDYVRFVAVDLDRSEGPAAVASPSLSITSDVVERALRDAEALIASNGATSGLDRVHTAIHGYLKQLCDHAHLAYTPDPTVTQLFKVIREQHPAFAAPTPYTEQVRRALNSLASVVDVLNSMRKNASPAHPNPTLLAEDEAMLLINATRTILHYLNSKTRQS